MARTGEEALKLVESFAPDAVLLDVMMPLKSGYEVCREIRGNPARRGTKIIMLTAKGRAVESIRGSPQAPMRTSRNRSRPKSSSPKYVMSSATERRSRSCSRAHTRCARYTPVP